jgi:hypothetical protein
MGVASTLVIIEVQVQVSDIVSKIGANDATKTPAAVWRVEDCQRQASSCDSIDWSDGNSTCHHCSPAAPTPASTAASGGATANASPPACSATPTSRLRRLRRHWPYLNRSAIQKLRN